VLAIVILALALRVPLLGRGLYYDELHTVLSFVEAPSAWEAIARVNNLNNHPLYSLLAHGAESVFGRAEWVVRLPALLFGLAVLPLLWLVVRRDFGPAPALLAALALATSSVHIGFSASARGYTGLIFFSWLSSALFVKLVRDGGSSRSALAYSVATALGIWIHLYALVVLGVQGLGLAILVFADWRNGGVRRAMARYRPAIAGAIGGVLLAVLCYAPALPHFSPLLLTRQLIAFVPLLPLKVLTYLTGRGLTPAGLFLAGTALAGLAIGLRRRRFERQYVALLFTVPLGAAWMARQVSHRDRFFVFLLPFLALGLALTAVALWAWVSRVEPGPARAGARAGAISLFLLTGWLWGSGNNVPRGGFREAVASLEAPPVRAGSSVGTCAIGIGATFYALVCEAPDSDP
jgi:hypothetical protein